MAKATEIHSTAVVLLSQLPKSSSEASPNPLLCFSSGHTTKLKGSSSCIKEAKMNFLSCIKQCLKNYSGKVSNSLIWQEKTIWVQTKICSETILIYSEMLFWLEIQGHLIYETEGFSFGFVWLVFFNSDTVKGEKGNRIYIHVHVCTCILTHWPTHSDCKESRVEENNIYLSPHSY